VKSIIVSVLAIVGLAFVSSANAQSQKIGYVNSTKIFAEMPEAQEAQKKIDAAQKGIQDEWDKRQAALKAAVDEYQKKESLMNDSAKKAEQEKILGMQQQMEIYRQEKLGNNSELAKMQETLLEPLKEKVLKAIEAVAKAEKYTFVFDKTETVAVLLYGEASNDLTFKVIDKLKRGK